ncbi:MAG: NAD(P)H-hydrate epimerase [bacterium]
MKIDFEQRKLISAQTKFMDDNALQRGIQIKDMMAKAGQGIADLITSAYGSGKKIAFVCGSGNNGGDGMLAALILAVNNDVHLYLLDDNSVFMSFITGNNWNYDSSKLSLTENATADSIKGDYDLVIEGIVGSGLKGDLSEEKKNIIDKLNKMPTTRIAIDIPAPDFDADEIYCLGFAKIPGAKVIDIGVPDDIIASAKELKI